jgi:hypothetical protein
MNLLRQKFEQTARGGFITPQLPVPEYNRKYLVKVFFFLNCVLIIQNVSSLVINSNQQSILSHSIDPCSAKLFQYNPSRH